MTAKVQLKADRLSELVDEAKEQQENLRNAWVELGRIHDEFYQGDSHIRAYVLDHLRILISDDHGFLSRDSSVSTLIEELQEAFEEASEPAACAVCGNPFDSALLMHDLCQQCHTKYANEVNGMWVALYRGGVEGDREDTPPLFGWTVYRPDGSQIQTSRLLWRTTADATENGIACACNIQLEELHPPPSPVDKSIYEIRRCSTG